MLAVRGDHLDLFWSHWTTDDGYTASIVAVDHADADGRMLSSTMFDPEDFAVAMQRLDEMYAASLPEEEAAVVRLASALSPLDGDAEASIAHLDERLVTVDTRKLGWGTLDRDGTAERVRSAVDAGYMTWWADIKRVEEGGLLGSIATTVDLADPPARSWTVVAFDQDRPVREEIFALEDLAAAEARFDELMGRGPRLATPLVTNRAAELALEAARAVAGGNVDALDG